MPKNKEELLARRTMIEGWSRKSYGMMGRTGDYVGSMMTAWAMSSDFFGAPFSERVVSFFNHCADKDLFLVHALVDPQIDRSVGRSEQKDQKVLLKIVRSDEKGIYVSGVKTIATSAAIADEIIVWPLPVPQTDREKEYAFSVSVRTNSPGLKIVCRDLFCPRPDHQTDFPLSSRFDEIDAVLIFEDVFVTWDRVFIYEDVERLRNIGAMRSRELTSYQTNIRLLVKLEFIYGVLYLMAESIGIQKSPAIQETLGECAATVEQLRALIHSSEEAGIEDGGFYYPALTPLQVGRLLGPKIYPQLMLLIKRLGGGGLMQVPSSTDLLAGPLGLHIEAYCGGAKGDARERVRLLRLAWDLAGSEFGTRHLLYEVFYSGDPSRLAAGFQNEYSKTPFVNVVKQFLSELE